MPLSMRPKSLLPTSPTPSQLHASNRSSTVLSPPPPLSSPPSSPPPSPTPRVYELTPPPPPSIAAASPNPPEDTEAISNSHRAHEEDNVSIIGNDDADSITKPQAQAPHNNPNGDIEDKTAHGDGDSTGDLRSSSSNAFHIPNTDVTSITNHGSSDCDHPHNPTNISNGSKCKLVYDPGGNSPNTENGATRDDGDITSSSSSGIVSRAADIHHSFDCDRDKTPFTTADVDPVLDFVHANRPVPDVTSPHSSDNLPAILHCDSKRTDAVRRPLCPLSPQRLADSLDAFPTDAHCTDALVLSLEASDDDDEDFAQHNHPHRDRRLPARYCTGNFVSSDTPRRAPSHLRPLTADTYRSLDTNNAVLANNCNNNNSSSNINAASIVNAHTINAHTANSSSSSVHGNTIGTDINAFNSGSANISPPAPVSTTTRDNEHKHARMPPLEIKPPPVLPMDTTPPALDSQVMQAIRPSEQGQDDSAASGVLTGSCACGPAPHRARRRCDNPEQGRDDSAAWGVRMGSCGCGSMMVTHERVSDGNRCRPCE